MAELKRKPDKAFFGIMDDQLGQSFCRVSFTAGLRTTGSRLKLFWSKAKRQTSLKIR